MYTFDGQGAGLMDWSRGMGQSSEDYCPAPTLPMCFQSLQERDTAQTQCQYNVLPYRPPGPCPAGPIITPDNLGMFRPCDIAHLDYCRAETFPQMQAAWGGGGGGTFSAQAEAEREDDAEVGEEENYTLYYVFGGVAVLAIGGIAFYMTRKR